MKTREKDQNKFSSKKIAKKQRTADKGKKNVNLFHILARQKYEKPDARKEEVAANVDLQKYNIDAPINQQNLEKARAILESSNNFSRNPNVYGIEWKELCNEVTQKLSKESYLIQIKNKNYFFQEGEGFTEISESEAELLNCTHTLLSKIKKGSSNPGLIGTVNDEIETVKVQLDKAMVNVEKKEESNLFNQKQNIQNKYWEVLAKKTLEIGLQNLEIDELNYFLEKEYQENSRIKTNEHRIKDKKEWVKFIQKKRVKLRKADKFILHNSCQFCFSNHSEQSNTFINCQECHTRGHRLCLSNRNLPRCGRCQYLRLQNCLKEKVKECFICNVKGLASIKISTNKYAHSFCLLLHGLWKIENENIVCDQNKEEQIINNNQSKVEICKFCQNSTMFYVRCQRCNEPAHYCCSFLNGANFHKAKEQYNITCCSNEMEQIEKQGSQRKFILNYQNIVFKKLKQFDLEVKNEAKLKNKKKTVPQKEIMQMKAEDEEMQEIEEAQEIEEIEEMEEIEDNLNYMGHENHSESF